MFTRGGSPEHIPEEEQEPDLTFCYCYIVLIYFFYCDYELPRSNFVHLKSSTSTLLPNPLSHWHFEFDSVSDLLH